MASKLNSMRLLETHGVSYEVVSFPDTLLSAKDVAAYVGLPETHVYKTLVVISPRRGPLLVMLAAAYELSLKRLARLIGEKKLRMATHREAEALTGLNVGGISALALPHKRFPVYLDRLATTLDTLLVSAGRRGVNVRLKVADLVRVTGAQLLELTPPEVLSQASRKPEGC